MFGLTGGEILITDRELLQLSAKAAGIALRWHQDGTAYSDVRCAGYWGVWNPLTDDGDALRLVVKLEMLVHVETCYYVVVCKDDVSVTEHIGNDGKGCIYAAARRAIVRLAAEIGRSHK